MANICDNMLTFYTRSVPKYLEENSLVERASVNDYSVQPDIKNDIEHVKEVIVNFDTKWSPPVDIYEKMIKDKSIIAFTARWYEPGCGLLGHATKDGIVEVPLTCAYSSELQLYVFKDQPPEDYIEIDGDENYILWDDYIKEVSAQEKKVVDILFYND